MMRYIDCVLYRRKLSSVMNRSKNGEEAYSKEEVKASRLLCKNTNGVVFASKLFSEMYPDATFIALARNGFALCEGYVRRGWTAERFGNMYDKVCRKMIDDANNMERYCLVRFEDMLRDPVTFIGKIFDHAGLDLGAMPKVRMRAKQSMDKDGNRTFMFGSRTGENQWVNIEDIGTHLRKDVNENQIARLTPQDREAFLSTAEYAMRHLGYL